MPTVIFPSAKVMRRALQVIVRQQELIIDLQTEKRDVELAYMRIGRDLIEQFLIALDKPEDHDLFRERLTLSLGFYRDEIAVREEHV